MFEYLLRTRKYKEALYKAEQLVITQAYEFFHRNQTLTAKSLGISRNTLVKKLKKRL